MRISAIGLLLLASLLPGCQSGTEVSAAEFGDRWPLTVSSGRIDCLEPGAAVFIHGGIAYSLNGLAIHRGYTRINPIWRDNPEIPGTKINISPLLDAALALC